FEGTHLRGAHTGVGRALLLRLGADQFEDLVQQHYLHEVIMRSSMRDQVIGMELPRNIIANALGCLSASQVGIDAFEAELAPRDVLVMCSARLCASDDELARVVRSAADVGGPLDELARRIERVEEEARDKLESPSGRDVAFGVSMVRPVVTW